MASEVQEHIMAVRNLCWDASPLHLLRTVAHVRGEAGEAVWGIGVWQQSVDEGKGGVQQQ